MFWSREGCFASWHAWGGEQLWNLSGVWFFVEGKYVTSFGSSGHVFQGTNEPGAPLVFVEVP